jgi:acyl-CoA synthetase (AMP-forming)/AMP-acid ligase II
MVVGDILRKNARIYAKKLAVVFGEHRFTWRELYERVNHFSNSLLGLGLTKGERVVFLSKNSHYFFEIWFSLAQTGLIGITPNYRLGANELSYVIKDSGASTIIVSNEYVEVIRKVLPEIPEVRFLIGIGENHALALDYEKMVRNGGEIEPNIFVTEDDIRLLMYTSGTTGIPKGAVWTHKSSIPPSWGTIIAAQLEVDDIHLNMLPLCLAGGNVACMAFCLGGAPTVILEEFDPIRIFETIEREKVTVTHLVPTMISSLINHPEIKKYDLSSLRLIMYGSAPISGEVLRQAMETFKCRFIQCYGATETSGFCGFLLPEDHVLTGAEKRLRKIASFGREAIWAELRVVDENGNDVKGDEVGEIIIKGNGVIKEYWKDPEKTKDAIKNGWWYSGDMAKMDEDGYISIVDRKTGMIISGGINIYPREIENVLYSHPAVKEAVVIGVPDREWGESVKAVVQLKEGMTANEEEIIDFCKQHLASYKKPKSVDFVDQFPLGIGGKILKRVVREQYWKGKDRRV